jgi:hypothetical protein
VHSCSPRTGGCGRRPGSETRAVGTDIPKQRADLHIAKKRTIDAVRVARYAEDPCDRRAPRIEVDEADVLVAARERRREINGRRRLSLTGGRARDRNDRPVRAFAQAHHARRDECVHVAVALVLAVAKDERCRTARQPFDRTHDGDAEKILDLVLGAHPGVERLAQADYDKRGEQADEGAEERVAQRARAGLRGPGRLLDEQHVARREGLQEPKAVQLRDRVGVRARLLDLRAELIHRSVDRGVRDGGAPRRVGGRNGVRVPDGRRSVAAGRAEGDGRAGLRDADGRLEVTPSADARRFAGRVVEQLPGARERLLRLVDARRVDIGTEAGKSGREVGRREDHRRAGAVERPLLAPHDVHLDRAEDDEQQDDQPRTAEDGP